MQKSITELYSKLGLKPEELNATANMYKDQAQTWHLNEECLVVFPSSSEKNYEQKLLLKVGDNICHYCLGETPSRKTVDNYYTLEQGLLLAQEYLNVFKKTTQPAKEEPIVSDLKRLLELETTEKFISNYAAKFTLEFFLQEIKTEKETLLLKISSEEGKKQYFSAAEKYCRRLEKVIGKNNAQIGIFSHRGSTTATKNLDAAYNTWRNVSIFSKILTKSSLKYKQKSTFVLIVLKKSPHVNTDADIREEQVLLKGLYLHSGVEIKNDLVFLLVPQNLLRLVSIAYTQHFSTITTIIQAEECAVKKITEKPDSSVLELAAAFWSEDNSSSLNSPKNALKAANSVLKQS